MGADLFGLGPNAGYLVAAYGVTGLILLGYATALWRQARKDQD